MSRPDAQKAKFVREDSVMGKEYEHPAFGMISVSRQTGGERTLFGSELKHNHSICIRIHEASTMRGLARDWNHARESIVELVMSEHQWASFVSSMNQGNGVPCTFTMKPKKYERMMVPSIIPENKHELHLEELSGAGDRLAKRLDGIVGKMKEMSEGKTIKKTEFAELMKSIEMATGAIKSGLSFHVDQHKEVMEKNVEAAKSDLEGYVTGMVSRLGLDALKDMAPQLEDKSDDGEST